MRHTNIRVLLALIITALVSPTIIAAEASRYVEAYPTAQSKKGLQVEDVADAIALGIKHAGINVDLCRLVDVNKDETADNTELHWIHQGKRFDFQVDYLQQLDSTIRELSNHGVIVYLIILTYQSDDERTNEIMLHPGHDRAAPNRLAMFNSVTSEGRSLLTATMEFLAERWSRPDKKFGRVDGYIVGNEVNSHWWWCNMGLTSMEAFADTYLEAVRIIHSSIRRQSSWARVYIPLDHHWGIRFAAGGEQQAFGGREFIDYFARRARQRGDFDWHVAFHSYPENLFDPRFWNDSTATEEENTPRITFKNLDVLTSYLQRTELLYDGTPRRVILSEQGFHTPDRPNGETIQAAAFCAAYKQVEKLKGIDAFILHRHIDNAHEGGLLLGLRALSPGLGEAHRKKLIYECFRKADTPEWKVAFEFALPIVGRTAW